MGRLATASISKNAGFNELAKGDTKEILMGFQEMLKAFTEVKQAAVGTVSAGLE